MGFYISDDIGREKATGLNQHINLSVDALDKINDDYHNYLVDNQKISKAGFYNTIFTNFYHKASATINERIINKRSELNKLFSSPEFKKEDLEQTNLYIKKMLDVYTNELIDLANSYEKGVGFKFRINKDNLEVLRQSNEDQYYGSIGSYLKAIFEEYASLPSYKREYIFYNENIRVINDAINRKIKLKISTFPKLNVKLNKMFQRNFYFTPYKIMQDKSNNYNYLVGYSELILNDGKTLEPIISSIRISGIYTIAPRISMGGYLSKDKIKSLNKAIKEKEVQYLVGNLIKIKIKFNEKGLELFHRVIYLRPNNYVDLGNNIYEFTCTELQAIFYFFKFGRDLEILKPVSLREKFIARYKEALNVYEDWVNAQSFFIDKKARYINGLIVLCINDIVWIMKSYL